jgi:hypothetical protein
VMVVCKNVLEYIIALVVVKNKVRWYRYGNILGNGVKQNVPEASIQKLINIDRSKTGRNCGINLKDVIELCHIF